MPREPEVLGLLALLGLHDRVVRRRADLVQHLRRRRDGAAELIDAAVVCDPIQPGPQRELTAIGPQSRVRAHEDVLQRILGVLLAAGQHLPGVGEQARAIAVVDDPEGIVVSRPEQRQELLVGAQPQQRCTDRDPSSCESCRCLEGGGFHEGLLR